MKLDPFAKEILKAIQFYGVDFKLQGDDTNVQRSVNDTLTFIHPHKEVTFDQNYSVSFQISDIDAADIGHCINLIEIIGAALYEALVPFKGKTLVFSHMEDQDQHVENEGLSLGIKTTKDEETKINNGSVSMLFGVLND